MATNKEVVRAWVDGRERSGDSLRSERDEEGITTLISYSTPIARRFRVNNGIIGEDYKTWVLFFVTTEKYSVTTSKHCSLARAEILGKGELFMVSSLPTTVELALVTRDVLLAAPVLKDSRTAPGSFYTGKPWRITGE